jgi:hypothetical protein
MNQSRVSGVIDCLNSGDSDQGVFTIICGRMTPSQREVARNRAEINTANYIDIIS